jgi:hypothetical protein
MHGKDETKLKILALLFCILSGIGITKIGLDLYEIYHYAPPIRATWVWDANVIVEEREKLLSFADEQKVNLIYLYFDRKLPPEDYRSFIKEASLKGIEIDALGGEPEWALTSHQERLDEFADRVSDFNANAGETERFSGIHLDIEPYQLPDWKRNTKSIIEQWTSNVTHLRHIISPDDRLAISADLPFWLDQYSVAGSHGPVPLSRWMMQQYDHVTFMAYRNYAYGKNGILDILRPEIRWANEDGSKFIVGVETKSTEEPHVTFHQEGQAKLVSEIGIVNRALRKAPAYLGYAVHQYGSWIKLDK